VPDRYFGLDPIKWAMMYILNEDGFRDLASHKVKSFPLPHLTCSPQHILAFISWHAWYLMAGGACAQATCNIPNCKH
jgi:hypothetical protein